MKDHDPDHPLPKTGSTDESADSVLRALAHPSTVDLPPERRPSPSTTSVRILAMPAVGDVIGGRYELTEVLGTGGMGAVFAARHKGTGREVAIKVLLPNPRAWRSDRVARFVREAMAAGRIRHPNVVDVYDVEGTTEPPYLVMERLHGESLGQRLRRGRLATEEAVEIVQQATRGVAEAHARGVIHRDLKPDNIFLARVEGSSSPVSKVLDFGVSRIVTPAPEQRATTLTRTGHVVGTPSYMPLEQLRGSANVDARVDVYALGVILYEAICGARPYQAENDHELVIRMATEAPRPLGERAEVDPFLNAVVMKALAREARDRYEDVRAFASALSRWQAGERRAEGMPHAGGGRTRIRVAVGAALLFVAILVAAWTWRRLAAPAVSEARATPSVSKSGDSPAPAALAPQKAAKPPDDPPASEPPAEPTSMPTIRRKAKPSVTSGAVPAEAVLPEDRDTTLKAEEF